MIDSQPASQEAWVLSWPSLGPHAVTPSNEDWAMPMHHYTLSQGVVGKKIIVWNKVARQMQWQGQTEPVKGQPASQGA